MKERTGAGHNTVRRWEATLVGSLLGLAALAWFATAQLSSPEMRVGLLTREAGLSSMPGGGSLSWPVLAFFLLTWVVMMVAMMFPAVVPVVLTFDRWVRRTGRSRLATALFSGGYLFVWSSIGLVFYAAIVYLEPLVPRGMASVRWGAALLVVAGAYQLTPLKTKCLRTCRSPLGFLAEHATRLRSSGLGPAKVGAVHGLYCVGCCWALMLVLVLLGMMSLAWMAAVAGVTFLEKALPEGSKAPVVVAALLIGIGGVLLVFPQTLPR